MFIPLVGYNYLWQRYNYLPRPSHDRVWWYATAVLGVLSGAVSVLGFVGVMPTAVTFLVVLPAAFVLSGLVSATLYMDARFLHDKAAREGFGRLNPANYLLRMWFAMLVSAVLPIQVLILAYYANKRRQIDALL